MDVLVLPPFDDTFPLELVDDELETLPLDDEAEDTLPLDDEETLPLDEDETLPLLPPLADDTLPLEPPLADDTFPLELEPPLAEETLPLDPPEDEVLETVAPPVLVDDPPLPPLDDVLLTPPVEEVLLTLPLEDPPVEVEPPLVDVEPPLVLLPPLLVDPPLDVDEITTLPPDPPPPKPPPNPPPKPPPSPPPKKPPPPITAGKPPPPPPEKPSPTGIGTGAAAWFATVTTVGAHVARVVVTTRRTRGPRWTLATWRRTTRLTACLEYSVRCGFSATCTAPPPMIAPPQAQAHNFAKAIRTDMIVTLSFLAGSRASCLNATPEMSLSDQGPNKRLSASALTTLLALFA